MALLVITSSCSDDGTTGSNGNTGHDGAVDNGDGTTTITLSGVEFTTMQPDFSGDPVVTTPTLVDATLVDSFDLSFPVERFRLVGDRIVGFVMKAAFDTELFVYDLTSRSMTSQRAPSAFAVACDVNGAVVSVEGSESVRFYPLDGSQIGAPFHVIPQILQSNFVADGLLDGATLFIYVRDWLLAFPVYDSGSTTNVVALPSSAAVRLAADEATIFGSVALLAGDSSIMSINKSDLATGATLDFAARRLLGLAVDANYLSAADATNDQVLVTNKHTGIGAGSFAVPDVGSIQVVGSSLYAASRVDGMVRQYTVSFTPN